MTALPSQESFCSMESATSCECASNRVNVFEGGILLSSSDHYVLTVLCTVLWVSASKLCRPYNINPLTLNNLKRPRAVRPLKIKIPSKNMHEKPTNTPIIYSVY
jgi:hypothetical protein